MRSLFRSLIVAAAATLGCGCAFAQANPSTPVTATQLRLGGVLIPAGNVTMTMVDAKGTAVAFTTADGTYNGPQGFSAAIVNGVLANGFAVPDQCTSSNLSTGTPLSYLVIVQKTTAPGSSSTFVIPPTGPGVCGSAAFALDHYAPAQSTPVLPTGIVKATTPPSTCSTTGATLFYRTVSPFDIRACVGGVFVPTSGSGGGGLALPSTFALLKGDNQGGAAAAVSGVDYVAPAFARNANNLTTGTIAPTIRGRMPSLAAQPFPSSTTILQALANAANQVVRIRMPANDSFTICDVGSCNSPATGPARLQKWSDLLRVQLQSIYGSHGTGVVPLAYDISAASPNANAWALTGTFDRNTTSFGPYINGKGALYHLASGATATFNDLRQIPWDTLHVYCVSTSTSGSLAVTIDGVSASANACPSTQSAQANNIALPAVALGVHTAVFTSTGDTYLYAVDGEAGTTGVSVDNLAVGGATAGYFGSVPATQLAFSDLIDGGSQADIVMDLINEAPAGTAPGDLAATLTAIIAHERALPSAPSILLVVPPVDIVNNTNPMAALIAAEKGLCTSLALTCLDINDRHATVGSTAVGWTNPYNPASGLWDMTAPLWGAGGVGGVHPSTKGHADIFQQVFATLVNPTAAAAQVVSSGNLQYGNVQLCTASCTVAETTDVLFANTAASATTLPIPATSIRTASSAGTYTGLSRKLYFLNSSTGP